MFFGKTVRKAGFQIADCKSEEDLPSKFTNGTVWYTYYHFGPLYISYLLQLQIGVLVRDAFKPTILLNTYYLGIILIIPL